MQTFLPYPSFFKSAQCLDYRRLGKQRVEAWQILQTLRRKSSGWKYHPAVKMWKGHEIILATYGAVMCQEWIRRGYVDTLLPRFMAFINRSLGHTKDYGDKKRPAWIGSRKFHSSHKSNLMRKDKVYYGKHFGNFRNDLPYVWPV